MPRQLNDEEIAQCQAAFCTVDKDNKGTIDAKDLGMVIESLGNAWFTGVAANTIFLNLLSESIIYLPGGQIYEPLFGKGNVSFPSSHQQIPCLSLLVFFSADTAPIKGPKPRLMNCFWNIKDANTCQR